MPQIDVSLQALRFAKHEIHHQAETDDERQQRQTGATRGERAARDESRHTGNGNCFFLHGFQQRSLSFWRRAIYFIS